MKSRIIYGCLIAATAIIVASSCSDYLEEDPKGQISASTFFTNQNELDMSVYALYNRVQDLQADSNTMIVQCQGDDMTSTTGSNKAAYLSADAFEDPSDAKGVLNLWSDCYAIIQAANSIIDNADGCDTTEEEINIAKGQAYYWRAYAYFCLVRVFGDLPVNLHNTPDNNETTLTSVEEIYNLIIEDLTAAENCDLPAQYTEENRVLDGVNIYISEQAVKATFAAVYMNMAGYPLNKTEYYANAASKAKEVIDGVTNGTYNHALESDWANIYNYGNSASSETIVGMPYRARYGGWSSSDSQLSSCHQFQSLFSGWGDFLAERYFWSTFPDGPRKNAVFAEHLLTTQGNIVDWWATADGQPYDGSNAVVNEYRPMYVGFTVNTDDSGSPIAAAYDYSLAAWTGMCINKYHYHIRYSEVLLWYAESAARSGGDLSAAKSALKQVMERAYDDQTQVSAVDGMSADEVAEQAFLEHGWEVAGMPTMLVTRRADEFRLELLKDHYDYRSGSQSAVLVPAGTYTLSQDASGNPFEYTTTEDLVLSENKDVTVAWNGVNSIYHIYPPSEVEKNPNLTR